MRECHAQCVTLIIAGLELKSDDESDQSESDGLSEDDQVTMAEEVATPTSQPLNLFHSLNLRMPV